MSFEREVERMDRRRRTEHQPQQNGRKRKARTALRCQSRPTRAERRAAYALAALLEPEWETEPEPESEPEPELTGS